jgi:hypothetical protein
MDKETKKRIEEPARQIVQMRAINIMVENAPKDSRGNAVADIVELKGFGLFYAFKN